MEIPAPYVVEIEDEWEDEGSEPSEPQEEPNAERVELDRLVDLILSFYEEVKARGGNSKNGWGREAADAEPADEPED